MQINISTRTLQCRHSTQGGVLSSLLYLYGTRRETHQPYASTHNTQIHACTCRDAFGYCLLFIRTTSTIVIILRSLCFCPPMFCSMFFLLRCQHRVRAVCVDQSLGTVRRPRPLDRQSTRRALGAGAERWKDRSECR